MSFNFLFMHVTGADRADQPFLPSVPPGEHDKEAAALGCEADGRESLRFHGNDLILLSQKVTYEGI